MLTAKWVEGSSNKDCGKLAPSYQGYPTVQNTTYWGQIQVTIDPSGDRFEGKWDYCEAFPPEKSTTEGERVLTKKAQTATINYKNGTYIGEVLDGKRHGQGTYSYNNGDEYVGDWKEDNKHGKGTLKYAKGNKYKGQWKNGKKNGKGTFTWKNGAIYKGEYKDNLRDGRGEYSYANGERYVGQYSNDKKNGKGTYFYKSGNKYVGDWLNNKKAGKGTFTWAKSGNKYVGKYHNNISTGGRFYWANGKISKWSYQDKNGKWVHTDGSGKDRFLAKGDISFVLTWTHKGDRKPNGPDIDIWVKDPKGNYLSSSKKSQMGPTREGGKVDMDDEGGYAEKGDEGSGGGPERVFCPKRKSPRGKYEFGFKHFEGNGSALCRIDVYIKGKKSFSRSDKVSPDKKESKKWAVNVRK